MRRKNDMTRHQLANEAKVALYLRLLTKTGGPMSASADAAVQRKCIQARPGSRDTHECRQGPQAIGMRTPERGLGRGIYSYWCVLCLGHLRTGQFKTNTGRIR